VAVASWRRIPDREAIMTPLANRQLRLDTGAVFLRLAAVFFILREAYVWLARIRGMRAPLAVRLLFFVFRKWATPYSILFALLFATAATIVLALLVRLVVEPLVRHWHAPWSDGSAGLFHVAANERVLASVPARHRAGRWWMAGTLVRTNLRVWFFPRAHDAEIWSRPLASVRDARLEPAPRVAWGYLLGWPERLVLAVPGPAGSGNGDGRKDEASEVFALLNPAAALAWFERPAPAASTAVPFPPVSTTRNS
jgi:hypothetical protein